MRAILKGITEEGLFLPSIAIQTSKIELERMLCIYNFTPHHFSMSYFVTVFLTEEHICCYMHARWLPKHILPLIN